MRHETSSSDWLICRIAGRFRRAIQFRFSNRVEKASLDWLFRPQSRPYHSGKGGVEKHRFVS